MVKKTFPLFYFVTKSQHNFVSVLKFQLWQKYKLSLNTEEKYRYARHFLETDFQFC